MNSTKVVAMMCAVHNWDTVLNFASTEKVDGIMAVLSDGKASYTFIYDRGQIKFYGDGDLHDTAYDSQRHSFAATPFDGPIQYTVTLYPTKTWMEIYINNVPLVACLVMVGLVVFTSLLFYFYDFLMNREAVHKDLVMQTKRQYVRYISHEIRTPLNVVHLGFQVLCLEMKKLQQDLLQSMLVGRIKDKLVESVLPRLPSVASIPISVSATPLAVQAEAESGFDNDLDKKLSVPPLLKETESFVGSEILDAPKPEHSNSFVSEKTDILHHPLHPTTDGRVMLSESTPSSRSTALINPAIVSEQVKDWLDLVQDIVESLNAAIGVLNDLIDYDKIDSGTMKLQKESLSIWSFVETSVHPFIVQARAKEIEMEIALQDSSSKDLLPISQDCEELLEHSKELKALIVMGDRVKLSQVLRNLVSNALKFTPAGGKVTVKGHWEREVQSTGAVAATAAAPSSGEGKEGPPSCGWLTKCQRSSTEPNQAVELIDGKYESAGRVRITVSDTGAGMSPDQVKQLFREGVQFNPNDLQAGQGSGLGLWITKGIVDSHGGKLAASSEGVDCGTTFTLTLPVLLPIHVRQSSGYAAIEEGGPSSVEDHEHEATPVERAEQTEEDDVRKLDSVVILLSDSKACEYFPNVLITDDSAVNRKMMSRTLQSVGFKCFQAADGQECVDLMKQVMQNEHAKIDVILMDFEMPRMNGPTACSTLRALGCSVPIIGVTGNVLNEDKQVFLEHGAYAVVQKPFSLSDLEMILKRLHAMQHNGK
jgi:signal transduction histidine kinase/ActR/RegA family two-component response regulator